MKYISLCSGIEAATVAWKPLGWEAVAFSEIEPFCCAVLKHHYPDTPNLGDMAKIKEETIDEHRLQTADLLVGGTPCQSFSIAGLRKGLADARGNLALRFLQLAGAMRPTWVLWENVPGVLSSNKGKDFGSFVGALAELGYGWAYRILDAQYFGVPQRRRRVFVVGYLGDWRRAAAVLFERESLSGHPPPSREAGPGITPLLEVGARTGGDGYRDGDGIGEPNDPMYSLQAGKQHGVATLVFDTTQVTSDKNYSSPKQGDPCHPLAKGQHPPAIAFDCKQSGEGGEVAPPLRALNHDKSHANAGGQMAVAYQCHGTNVGPMGHLRSGNQNVTGGVPFKQEGMAVRRLTPVECLRLQGFPDDYLSQVTYRKKNPPADGPMYRAIGNSMAVPVMRWLGERIENE